MISLEKWYILTPLQKMPKNVWDLGKFIVAKGFKKLSKVKKKIAQSGHTDHRPSCSKKAARLFCSKITNLDENTNLNKSSKWRLNDKPETELAWRVSLKKIFSII